MPYRHSPSPHRTIRQASSQVRAHACPANGGVAGQVPRDQPLRQSSCAARLARERCADHLPARGGKARKQDREAEALGCERTPQGALEPRELSRLVLSRVGGQAFDAPQGAVRALLQRRLPKRPLAVSGQPAALPGAPQTSTITGHSCRWWEVYSTGANGSSAAQAHTTKRGGHGPATRDATAGHTGKTPQKVALREHGAPT